MTNNSPSARLLQAYAAKHPTNIIWDEQNGWNMDENTPAYALGYERGVSTGTWVIDGNTSTDHIRFIAKGIEDGDPEVLDMQPSPLSGEWADDPTIADVLAELGMDEDSDGADDALAEYETGFSNGYWLEVENVCRYHLVVTNTTDITP